MPLLPGARVGPYEVLAFHGAGGMGEVYLGHDERLDRRVAIKILGASHQADEELERFQREARAISRVTHPHICAIYDVGRQDDTPFLIMEFLEGETLGARLEEGPLSLERALVIGSQVAEALEAGHRHGVIHRDLTPGNVMLTASGAKLLDFGLAKLHPDHSNPGAANTKSAGLTGEGIVFGTLPYMAPEQVEGLDADARTDVFALGVMLYEMTTGRRPFQGKSSASLAAAILAGEPQAISSLPPIVDRTIRKCLAKNPDDRWQSARDLASELQWMANADLSRPVMVQDESLRRPAGLLVPRWAAWTAAALVVGVMAAAATAWGRGASTTPDRVIRFPVRVPSGYQFTGGQRTTLAISPNGRLVAFVTAGRLYLQRLDRFGAEPIPGTEGATVPFFSPDSVWLGFNRADVLMRVRVAGGVVGGPAVKVVDAGDPAGGAAWGFDDRIVFARGLGNGGLWTVPMSGGPIAQITTVSESENETQHMWPAPLRDGTVLYTVLGPSGHALDAKLVIEDVARHERTVVAEGVTFGRYLDTGHLLFVDEAGTLLLQPFDLKKRRTTGPAKGVLAGVRVASWGGAAGYAVSSTGTLVFATGTEFERYVLREVEPAGRVLRTIGTPQAMSALALSPKSQTMAMMVRTATNDDIQLVDLATGRFNRFSFGVSEDESPIWSPDGQQIAYSAAAAGEKRHVVVKPVGNGGDERIIYTGRHHLHLSSWSPDGEWIAFTEINPTSFDIWLLNVRDPSKLLPVATASYSEAFAVFSPDGKWLAYVSNETGRNEVYVVAFPSLDAKRQVSSQGGSIPRWSATGRDLFFVGSSPQRLSKATRAPDSRGIAWGVAAMFDLPGVQDFVPAHDERSFYVVTANTANLAPDIFVIQNWFDEVLPGSRLPEH